MTCEFTLSIAGLGIIVYSPFAVRHIAEGEDYLTSHFQEEAAVAAHVRDCSLTAFGTCSPGDFRLRIIEGEPDEAAIARAEFKLRLGLEVRDPTVCFRDLYELMDWSPECPAEQRLQCPDGFYRLTIFTSRQSSGLFGDNQLIQINFEPVPVKPVLAWDTIPTLC